MADVKLRIDVGAETAAANAALAEVGAAAERVSEAVGDLHVDADVSEANAALAEVGAAAERVSESLGGTEGAAEGAEDALAEVGDSAEAAAGGANAANAALTRLNSATSRMSGAMRGFTERIREASSAMRERLAKSAASLASSLGSAGFTAAKVGLGAVTAAFGAATAACVKLGAGQEQTRLKFGVLLGDAAKGNKLFGQLKEFANATPFSTNEVVKAGQSLLSFGVAAGDVQDTLEKVGNAAAATGVNVAEMAAIYGKAMVKGKVEAETLNQMSERGVPIIKALAKQMGVAEKEVYKMTSQGKIGANDLRKAFFSLSEAGGAYSGMMEKQSRTVGGLWSTLVGKIQAAAATLGEQLMPSIQRCLDAAIGLADALALKVETGDALKGVADAIVGITPAVAEAMKGTVSFILAIKAGFGAVYGTIAGLLQFAVGGIMGLLSACFKLGVDLGAGLIGGTQWLLGKIFSLVTGLVGKVAGLVRGLFQGILDSALWVYNKVGSLLHLDPVELELGDWEEKVKQGPGAILGEAFQEAAEDTFSARNKIFDQVRPYDAFAAELGVGGLVKMKDSIMGVPSAMDASDAFDKSIDRIAGNITAWAKGLGNDVKATAKKQAEDAAQATLEKAALEQAAPAIRDIVADRGLARQVDSLATIGLYNFSRSAEDNLDLRRNNLLEAIRNGIDRMASQGQGGQVRAMPALGSV